MIPTFTLTISSCIVWGEQFIHRGRENRHLTLHNIIVSISWLSFETHFYCIRYKGFPILRCNKKLVISLLLSSKSWMWFSYVDRKEKWYKVGLYHLMYLWKFEINLLIYDCIFKISRIIWYDIVQLIIQEFVWIVVFISCTFWSTSWI